MNAILVRHGHTPLNDTGTYFSTRDPGLSELGTQQAGLVADILAGIRVDAIFSSPLQRARQTAEILGRNRRIKVETDPRLAEFDTGEFEGLDSYYLEQNRPEFLGRWQNNPADLQWPGGESLRMAGERIVGILTEKSRKFKGLNVVFVSHALVIKAGLCLLTGMDPGNFRMLSLDPASVSAVRFGPDGVRLLCLNVTAAAGGTCKPPIA